MIEVYVPSALVGLVSAWLIAIAIKAIREFI